MRLSLRERVLEFFNLLFLYIILPTLLTSSDLYVAYELVSISELGRSFALFSPLFLNFLFNLLAWCSVEKTDTNRWSWPFLLVLVWPQWKVANLIQLISWKGNVKTGISKKKELYKSISPLQPVPQSTSEIFLKSLLYGHLSKKEEDRGLADLLGQKEKHKKHNWSKL